MIETVGDEVMKKHEEAQAMSETKIKEWDIRVYDRHIGIVDEDGCTVLSMAGERGDQRVWDQARLIVRAVNHFRSEMDRGSVSR